jgi:hypothetical protein
LLLDEHVALAAALPHVSDLRQLDHRDSHRPLEESSVVRRRVELGKAASRSRAEALFAATDRAAGRMRNDDAVEAV